MNERTIPIFFNTDNEYVVPTYISLFSLLHNYHSSSIINAFILVPNEFHNKNSFLLKSLSKRFQNVKIEILKMEKDFDSVLINQEHITSASMYRLLIPRIADSSNSLNMDTCIYLDSDLVVEKDISELFDIDIDGYYIGGVGDWLQLFDDRELPEIPSMDKYINSGVLLFNLKEINKTKGPREKLEKAGYRDDFLYNDQDAINSVFYGKIKLLPLKYNAMTPDIYQKNDSFYKQYGKGNIEEARKDPVIVHYITDKKPWLYKNTIMADRWWRYIKMQDKGIMNEYIIPFLNSHKESLYKRAKETVKTFLKHTGLYYKIKGKIR